MSDEFEFEDGDSAIPYPTIIAALGGALVLVVGTLFAPSFLPRPALPVLLGGGAALGLLLWVIGYLVAIRHATMPWKLGTLAMLVLGGAAAGYGAERRYDAQAAVDASSFAEADVGPGGVLIFPRGADGRGTLSPLFVQAAADAAKDERDFGEQLAGLKVAALAYPYSLEQHPEALQSCDAIEAAKAQAAERSKRRAERTARLVAAVEAPGTSAELRKGLRMMASPGGEPGAADPQLASEQELLDATAGLCRLLARRTWVNQMARFAFRSPADLNAYNGFVERRRAVSLAAQQASIAARERVRAGQEIVREALSR